MKNFITNVIISWWVKHIGRVYIPKWLYWIRPLSSCDFCGQNSIGKCKQVVDYGWFKTCWHEDFREGYLYAHANKSDCDANRWLIKQKHPDEVINDL